jgi:hypothetical protein
LLPSEIDRPVTEREQKLYDFVGRVYYHYNNEIPCLFGGETAESGVDCRGLALLSMREITGKNSGSFQCDKFGIGCDSAKHIPSTSADGLLNNYHSVNGGNESAFDFTYESDSPEIGGLTVYDWMGGGKYDHINIVVNVDKEGYRTWIYSTAACLSNSYHLKLVSEKDLIKLKDKIIAGESISFEEKTVVGRLKLIQLDYLERLALSSSIRNDLALDEIGLSDDEINNMEDETMNTVSKNLLWNDKIIYD